MSKKTFIITNHPTIKELSVEDKVVLYDGTVAEVKDALFANTVLITTYDGYSINGLKYISLSRDKALHPKDIKYKIPSLKDKIDLL